MSLLSKTLPALFVSLSVAACGTEAGSDMSYEPGPDRPDPEDPTAFSIDGTYRVSTHFDLSAANIGIIQDISDFAEDPVGEVADAIADKVGVSFAAGFIANAIDNIVPEGAEADIAEFLAKVEAIGQSFDVESELAIDGASATHRTTALSTVIDASSYSWAFADSAVVEAAITASSGRLEVSEHSLAIPYSSMIATAIDEVLVPTVVAGGEDIGDALAELIGCEAIGERLANDYGDSLASFGITFGSSAFEGMCEAALDRVAADVYNRIEGAKGLDFDVALIGAASADDTSGDGLADTLAGEWQGSFDIAGLLYEHPASFAGERM